MATLESLQTALRQIAASFAQQPLSDTMYSDGFDILVQDLGWIAYEDFIIPQLSQLLTPLFDSSIQISALEIGPGPKSVLGHLPDRLRRKIIKYTAFEPNQLFATALQQWLSTAPKAESPPLPCVETGPTIHRIPFALNDKIEKSTSTTSSTEYYAEKYDIILFCHSMYGMRPKREFIERALEMLTEQRGGGLVAVVHRDEALHLDGLVCSQTASFPTGVTRVADNDAVLDSFASFIAGFTMQDVDVDKDIRADWRRECRAMGRRDAADQDYLLFSSPTVISTFTHHSTALPELKAQLPFVNGDRTVKNREARIRRPASIIRPTKPQHIQQCVRWALRHGVSLTVIAGGHSGHCLQSNVVALDMGAFDRVHIVTGGSNEGYSKSDLASDSMVVAEVGCKTGDIIRKTMAAGLTVPLGSRPSVGAGLLLQGGIGHLARLFGLACDVIIGAVVISVDSGQILYVGCVPTQHRPPGAVRPKNEKDLLWAIKGVGSNYGIVVSVTLQAYTAPTYLVRNLVAPLNDEYEEPVVQIRTFETFARSLSRNCSADAYLYCEDGQLRLGIAVLGTSTPGLGFDASPVMGTIPGLEISGLDRKFHIVDGVQLFETEMYMSRMHGGHGGGKTSSFKRCLFLGPIGGAIADVMVAAFKTRPTPLCYLHLLHGGGAIGDLKADASAFGCRDWEFACVVTGVWPRDEDGTNVARDAVQWVYHVANTLLPLSTGTYGADLGPDPRDAALAEQAFGPNRPRLARLKRIWDPHNVLAYACPLPKTPMEPKLIILVTGESCAGKDYCAGIWVSGFTHKGVSARAVSISDATKREYATATSADLNLLLTDRAYKEQHRPALTKFFQDQVQRRPRLPEEHFRDVVYGATDVDVLLITGMRDEAPVATFSHLVPDSKLLEVRVRAGEETRQIHQGNHTGDSGVDGGHGQESNGRPKATTIDWCPSLIFDNDTTGNEEAIRFAENNLHHHHRHEDLQRLENMVRSVPNFPRQQIEFHHVLGISQQRGGLALCTSLLQRHFAGDWARISAVACCEAGGFVFASALASIVEVPLALIRESGKLPPPTISVAKPPSHISSLEPGIPKEKRFEMEQDVIPRGTSVVVVDDVLATGETLCAVLKLLDQSGISLEAVTVMVVAEFPVHRGRELLRQRGFGRVNIQSLLIFGGA